MSVYINDVNLKFNGQLKLRSDTKRIVVHHSDADGRLTIYQIHQMHLNKSWAGIGYHYYIKSDGSVWKGRPENTIGAHVFDYNSESIGICLGGDFTIDLPTNEQMKSLVELIKDIEIRYGNLEVNKHSDLNATQCPGNSFPWTKLQTLLTEPNNNVTGGATLNLNEAIDLLVEKKIITSPEYWQKAIETTRYIDQLIISMANYIKVVK